MSIFRFLLVAAALLFCTALMYSLRTWFITPINPLNDLPRVAIVGALFSMMGLLPLLLLEALTLLIPRAWRQDPAPPARPRPFITLLKAWPICLALGFILALLIAAIEERRFIASSPAYFAANPAQPFRFQDRLWPFDGMSMGIDRTGRTWTND